ncbi:TPA: phage terminase large subunit, partial [Staphylococcus aureus]|nr:phage terminase large subunit [Staphylococcus aureus]
ALYQQRPAPEDGDYFKAEWLRPYTEKPAIETMRIYGASDYAVTADGGDYTVHGVVGLDPEGRPWLLDLWRGQTDSAVWIDAWCDMVLDWRPMEWGEEGGQIRGALGPFIDKRARERGVFVYRRAIPSRHDKAIRAQSIRGLMAMRGLYVPVNAPWYPAFKSELLSFPAGKHDDQVDFLSLVGQLLDTAFNGQLDTEDEDDRSHERGRSSVTGY